jgi:hypothetical protein
MTVCLLPGLACGQPGRLVHNEGGAIMSISHDGRIALQQAALRRRGA